jgi:hypothetical protein
MEYDALRFIYYDVACLVRDVNQNSLTLQIAKWQNLKPIYSWGAKMIECWHYNG